MSNGTSCHLVCAWSTLVQENTQEVKKKKSKTVQAKLGKGMDTKHEECSTKKTRYGQGLLQGNSCEKHT